MMVDMNGNMVDMNGNMIDMNGQMIQQDGNQQFMDGQQQQMMMQPGQYTEEELQVSKPHCLDAETVSFPLSKSSNSKCNSR